jgi:hypothetical protein
MNKSLYFVSVASIVGLLFSSTAPVVAQERFAVPNSATRINCAPAGGGSVTTTKNEDVAADQNVAGTAVTSLNPFGAGTAETQTPLLTKPSTVTTVQCPHTALPSANVSKNAPAKAHVKTNALSSNPNGASWLNKYAKRAKTLSGGS